MGPKLRAHTDALTFKNTIIKYWPRSIVDGQDTFGSVYTWIAGQGVLKDNAHRRIYHVIGMKIKDMEKQSYNDLDYTYMHLNAYNAPNGAVTEADVRNYITDYSPIIYPAHTNVFNPDPVSTVDMNIDPDKGTADARWDKDGWIRTTLVYRPTTIDLVDNSITDQQIIQKVHDISYKDIFYDQYTCSRLTALAMLDTGNVVFETQVRIVSKTVVLKDQLLSANNIGIREGIVAEQIRYVNQAQIEFSFRRIADVHVGLTLSPAITAYLLAIDTKVESLIPVAFVLKSFGIRNSSGGLAGLVASKARMNDMSRSLNASVNQQLCTMANWVNPYANDHTLIATDPTMVNSYYADSKETQVKISGLIDLPPLEFKKQFVSLIKFDYKVHEKKGHWYDKVVSIVILVVAVVVAVLGTPASGGTSWGLVAAALGIGALAEGLWAMYLVKNGGSSSAISTTMGLSNALGIAAMIAGITAIYQSWARQSFLQATTKAAEEAALNAVESGASQAVIDSTAQALGNAYAASSATSMGSILTNAATSAVQVGGKVGIVGDDVAQYAELAAGSVDGITTAFSGATTTALESVQNNIMEGIKKFVSKPLSEIMNQCVNWINTAFNAYMMMVAPANEGLADKQAALDKLSKEVENTNPENMENIWTMYTDPYGSVFEVGDIYDKCVPMLTSGSISSMMNKCYTSYR
jgi:ribosomal protein L27